MSAQPLIQNASGDYVMFPFRLWVFLFQPFASVAEAETPPRLYYLFNSRQTPTEDAHVRSQTYHVIPTHSARQLLTFQFPVVQTL